MFDHTHPTLNEEITAIGGHFVFTKEELLPHAGDQVLYYVGYAVVDTSCCGVGGTAYASVAGYVRRWHCATSAAGRPVSRLEAVQGALTQNNIRRAIREKEMVQQVVFM